MQLSRHTNSSPQNRRRFLQNGLGLLAGGFVLPPSLAAQPTGLVRQSRKALGTTVSIQAIHADTTQANNAIEKAFDAIERVERSMSLYRADSEITRLNRDGIVEAPSPAFSHVLSRAQELSRESNGAFDITIQPLWDLYKSHASRASLPGAALINQHRRHVDWRQLVIESQAIRLKSPQAKITLNGLAQGFATDQAKEALQKAGIKHALIDCGELGALGTKATGSPWKVGIQHPRDVDAFSTVTNLGTRSLATSGDYETRFAEDFKHHHIFDPRTGQSPTEIASASVLAPTAMEADALSTTLMVLGIDEGLAFLSRKPEVDALIITKGGTVRSTEGFPSIPA